MNIFKNSLVFAGSAAFALVWLSGVRADVLGEGSRKANSVSSTCTKFRLKQIPLSDRAELTAGTVFPNDNWQFDIQVSSENGLKYEDVYLGKRFMAHYMGIDSYSVTTTSTLSSAPNRKKLKANRCYYLSIKNSSYNPARQVAKYIDDKECLRIVQDYGFTMPERNVEPHQYAPSNYPAFYASRFFPKVRYVYEPRGADKVSDFSFNVAQEFRFMSSKDGPMPQNISEFNADPNLIDAAGGTSTAVKIAAHGGGLIAAYRGNQVGDQSLATALSKSYLVIKDGAFVPNISNKIIIPRVPNPDNYHQTYKDHVAPPGPGIKVPSIRNVIRGKYYFGLHPGCPECIHIHWRWSDGVRQSQYGKGRALVITPTQQDVRVASTLSIAKGQKNGDVRFWYVSTGKKQVKDTFFQHGGFYSSLGQYALTGS